MRADVVFMVLLYALLFLVPSFAARNSDVVDVVETTSAAGNQAEYHRLQQELRKLAKRNAWAGVERTYIAMLETGVEPDFEDYRIGAWAAQSLGNIAETRARLKQASALKEDRELIDWLWAIDTQYGVVHFTGDPGKVELAAAAMPFDPTKASAVRFAAAQVADTGAFEGMLPHGEYTFGQVPVVVGSSARRVDLRSDDGVRQSERDQKRSKKKKN